MRRWVVYTAGCLFVGIIGGGLGVYRKYEPVHHFEQVDATDKIIQCASSWDRRKK